MGDIERNELRQFVADLAELKAAMRRRQNLPRESPEWTAAVEAEERLIARIQEWAQREAMRHAEKR
jgi:hypothetical protein